MDSEMTEAPEHMEGYRGKQAESESKLNPQRPETKSGFSMPRCLRSFKQIPVSIGSGPAHTPATSDHVKMIQQVETDNIEALRSQIQRLESQASLNQEEYRQEIGKRDAKIANLEYHVKENENRARQTGEKFQRKKASFIAHCNKEMNDRDNHIEQLNQQVESLHQAFTDMQENNEKLQGQVRVAQEGAFRAMKEASWVPKEDGAIRDEFSRLEEKVKSWVKTYSVYDIGDLGPLSDTEKNSITEYLRGCITKGDWDSLVAKITPGLRKRAPVLFTHAILATHIFERVFHDPFFAFKEIGGTSNAICGSGISQLYGAMTEVSSSEAHIWRSEMIRLLTMSPSDSTKAPLLSPQRIGKASISIADDFLHGPAKTLLKQAETGTIKDKCKQELYQIYRNAGELSMSLWCQRTFMSSYFLLLNKPRAFFRDDPSMIAHRLHRLDEDDERLDGKEILAIIQPALVAFGNENAENYDKWKVWSRAVVVVDEGKCEDVPEPTQK